MQIGQYVVTSELGRGVSGAVLRANSSDGREVAIKLLHRLSADGRARFERERSLLGTFGEAQGFVSLIDSGESPQGPYLVMPLLAGGTLRDRLRRGPLGIVATIELGVALGRALGSAHERGIVHRDLKPDNILFTAEGKPLVADLGLAKHFVADDRVASGVSLSRTGDFRGTAGYMAPEQINDSKRIGPASDVFALGTILQECLTGVPVFSGETLIEIASKVDSGDTASLREQCPEAPRWLETVIVHCLDRDPEKRYPDGNALARALEEGLSPPRAVAVQVLAVVVAGILGLLAAAGIAYAVLGSREEAPKVAPTARPSASPTPRPTPVEDAADLEARAAPLVGPDNAGAIPLLERAVAADPKRTTAWFALGLAYYNHCDYRASIRAEDRTLELDPKFARAFEIRGAARSYLFEPAEALGDYLRAIELDPKLGTAWARLAIVRERLHDLNGAMEAVKRALEVEPGLPTAFWARARVHFDRSEYDAAIADTTRVIDGGALLNEAFFTRAASYANKGDYIRALKDFDRLVELAPQDASAYQNRATVHLALHHTEEALKDATRAVELAPNELRNWVIRGNARTDAGDKEGAIADFEKALSLPGISESDPDVIVARRNLKLLRGQ